MSVKPLSVEVINTRTKSGGKSSFRDLTRIGELSNMRHSSCEMPSAWGVCSSEDVPVAQHMGRINATVYYPLYASIVITSSIVLHTE